MEWTLALLLVRCVLAVLAVLAVLVVWLDVASLSRAGGGGGAILSNARWMVDVMEPVSLERSLLEESLSPAAFLFKMYLLKSSISFK